MLVYLVGGAIRDKLLGLEVKDKDFVVVGATENEMLAQGFIRVGADFPVFLHPKTKQEYALARAEKKVSKGYKGFVVATKNISLAEDLLRRDLTINAIAQDKKGNIIDPYNGVNDLNNGILRHISPAFIEDPVRILRIARFAARFKTYGFKLAQETHKLIKLMVKNGDIDSLVPERVWAEIVKVLSYKTPSEFFRVLKSCAALDIILPKLTTSKINLAHNNKKDEFLIIDNLNTNDIAIKWAILCSNLAVDNVKNLVSHLKCPKKVAKLAILSASYVDFIKNSSYDNKQLLDFYLKTDAFRNKERFLNLIKVFELLAINTRLILDIWHKLLTIKITSTNNKDIVTELTNKRQDIIKTMNKTPDV